MSAFRGCGEMYRFDGVFVADPSRRPMLRLFNGLASPGLLFVFLLLVAVRALAGGVTLAWDAVSGAAGYTVYYGPAVGNYTANLDVGNTTTSPVTNLTEGATSHFAVTAYNAAHTQSGFSNDVSATIAYSAPVAQFSASATSGTAPLAVNFSSTSTGTISTYAWAFGDSTTSSSGSPSHVYSSAGVYTVSLTVTGPGGGNTRTNSSYITVSAPLQVTTTVVSSAQNPSALGVSVKFTATVTRSAPTGNVNFKDGATSITGCGAVPLTGTGNSRTAACSTTALATGNHSITAVYAGNAANAGSTSTVLTQNVNGVVAGAPTLQAAASRKVHGAAGIFDLSLSLVPTNPGTEPRQGPAATVVLTFNKPLTGATVAVTEGTATAGAPTFSGNAVVVNLTGVADQQYVTVSLTNVASADGGTGGSGSVRIGFLTGDVSQGRVVTLADSGALNAQLSQPVTAANYLMDVNASGTLTLADKGITSANLTKALPAP